MKVLLVGEGKHEQGKDAKDEVTQPGALESLVSQILPRTVEFEQRRVSDSTIHAFHGKGGGYFKRAVAWMRAAQREGFDAIILLIDEDHCAERVGQIDDAQKSPLATIPRALGTAIHTFDAWMLADERALSAVLERTVQKQPDPEEINDPKSTCKSLLDGSEVALAPAEMYAAVAAKLDMGTLEQRCPKGFAPFAQRVRQL